MQTILGANGIIGSVLAKELSNYTDRIRLVSRNPRKVNVSDELFPADLTQPRSIERAVAGSEIVYLVVGLDYKLKVWMEEWPKIMRATLDSCIRHKARLVFFDNVYSYGIEAIPHMTEESEINPPSKKGKVREQIVNMILNEVKEGNLLAIIARSADFYGPGNEKSFVTEMVYRNLKKGNAANWFIDADKRHSFTFTPDAAKATAILGNTDNAYNQVWHLPTDSHPLTGREFIEIFSREMNCPGKVSVMPMWLIRILGFFIPVLKEMREMMYQYDRDYFFDSSKFESHFNFTPTPYQEGVKLTVNGATM